jgi:hypothetical protein
MWRLTRFAWLAGWLALAILGFVILGNRSIGSVWATSAQVIVLFATVLMLGVVWQQLAVQTVIGILNIAQDESSRNARERLFRAEEEEEYTISKLCCSSQSGQNKWRQSWKDDADLVAQSWSSVGYLLRVDPVASLLLKKYVAKTRRTIIVSRYITHPRVAERRDLHQGGQPDLWDDFDWLAKKAAKSLKKGELSAWRLPEDLKTRITSSTLANPCPSSQGSGCRPAFFSVLPRLANKSMQAAVRGRFKGSR